jgi:4-diphosphocytidyl-2-C-methyl-D-erythritol kinase
MSLRALYDLPAPAKLNLFLHVVGRRPDGYHLLESAFVLIDWADVLHIERRDDGRILRHDLTVALPAVDLCVRAARAMQQAGGVTLGADITIDKRVPSGAGLGGGSSDAATVLLALNRLWGLHWSRERLMSLAATLGADVPFFVFGEDALVQGIGEQLSPLGLPRPGAYVVIKPTASIPTEAIFRSPLLPRSTPSVIVAGSLECTALQLLTDRPEAFGRNDLQSVAQAQCADVVAAANWLERHVGPSRMTGSGSAVFSWVGTGLLPEATCPPDSMPEGWVGRPCRGLSTHPLRSWTS